MHTEGQQDASLKELFPRFAKGSAVISRNPIVIIDTKVSPKTQKKIDEQIKLGLCLCGCERKATRRGLSNSCYYAWRQARAALRTIEKQAEYDSSLIRRGLLLPANGVLESKRRNKSVYSRLGVEIE